VINQNNNDLVMYCKTLNNLLNFMNQVI